MNTLTDIAAQHGPMWAGGGGPGWWIVFPILWFLIIATVVILVGRFGRRRWAEARSGVVAGRSRLAERFASGEIDEQEYRRRLAVLDEVRRT
ncbi:SHOCT domain-containing protein [Occultella glacieicola]|nr:SHOCT domain-containing protein [Occultella glacieicola]